MDNKRTNTKKESDNVLELVYQQLFMEKKPAKSRSSANDLMGEESPSKSYTSSSLPKPKDSPFSRPLTPTPKSSLSKLEQIEAEILPELWTNRERVINLSKLIILNHLAKLCNHSAPEITGKLTLEDTMKIQKLLSETEMNVQSIIEVIESVLGYLKSREIIVDEKKNAIRID